MGVVGDGAVDEQLGGAGCVTVDSNGMIRVSVPMFYRVRGSNSVPSGMALIPAGSFTMGNCMDSSEGYVRRTAAAHGLCERVLHGHESR